MNNLAWAIPAITLLTIDGAASVAFPQDTNAVSAIKGFGGTVKTVPGKNGSPQVHVELTGKKVTDNALFFVQGLAGLTELNLEYSRVTDAGMVHLKTSVGLSELNLIGTRVTSKGLGHLRGLTGLRHLSLSGTDTTDSGVKELTGMSF